MRQLGEEIRRLKQRESSLDAENKILKSQMLHLQDPLTGKATQHKIASQPEPATSYQESNNPFDNYDNYGYDYSYNDNTYGEYGGVSHHDNGV